MNSRSKPTGPRKSGTRSRKPATIDLEAKKVENESAQKAGAAAKTPDPQKQEAPVKPLGREGAKSSPKPEEKAETPPTAEAPPTPASAGNSGGGFFSGLVGAAAAVIGLGVVGQFDGAKDFPLIGSLYSNSSEQPEGAGISQEIAGLTQQIEALKSSSAPVDLTPIRDRLDEIEAARVSGGVDEATANRLAEVETSLAGVTETLATIAQAAEEGSGASSGEIAAAISSVTQRLEKVEASVGDLANASSVPSEETISKLSAIEDAVDKLSNAPATDFSPLESKIGEMETSISSIKETVEANASSVAELNSQSATLQETVASVKASETVARSVAVNALGAALENDDPISLAVASIEALGGKTEETQRLLALSKEGVPTQKSLLTELSAFTNTVQNPVADTGAGGISERFWANAKNLVSFRSSGPQEGDSEVAILSRVKASLEAGNLSGVVSEWDKLPAETKRSGEDWIAKVNKRREAFALYNTLSSNLSAQAG